MFDLEEILVTIGEMVALLGVLAVIVVPIISGIWSKKGLEKDIKKLCDDIEGLEDKLSKKLDDKIGYTQNGSLVSQYSQKIYGIGEKIGDTSKGTLSHQHDKILETQDIISSKVSTIHSNILNEAEIKKRISESLSEKQINIKEYMDSIKAMYEEMTELAITNKELEIRLLSSKEENERLSLELMNKEAQLNDLLALGSGAKRENEEELEL